MFDTESPPRTSSTSHLAVMRPPYTTGPTGFPNGQRVLDISETGSLATSVLRRDFYEPLGLIKALLTNDAAWISSQPYLNPEFWIKCASKLPSALPQRDRCFLACAVAHFGPLHRPRVNYGYRSIVGTSPDYNLWGILIITIIVHSESLLPSSLIEFLDPRRGRPSKEQQIADLGKLKETGTHEKFSIPEDIESAFRPIVNKILGSLEPAKQPTAPAAPEAPAVPATPANPPAPIVPVVANSAPDDSPVRSRTVDDAPRAITKKAKRMEDSIPASQEMPANTRPPKRKLAEAPGSSKRRTGWQRSPTVEPVSTADTFLLDRSDGTDLLRSAPPEPLAATSAIHDEVTLLSQQQQITRLQDELKEARSLCDMTRIELRGACDTIAIDAKQLQRVEADVFALTQLVMDMLRGEHDQSLVRRDNVDRILRGYRDR